MLEEVRSVLIELSELDTCLKLFEEAFAHYQTAYPDGQTPLIGSADPERPPQPQFGLIQILVLADLYNTLGHHEKAIEAIRRGCRWLQGRGSQKYWDAIEDDREWDVPPDAAGENMRHVAEGEIQPGMYPLDVNARHRLAIARIKLGEIAEGNVSTVDAMYPSSSYPSVETRERGAGSRYHDICGSVRGTGRCLF